VGIVATLALATPALALAATTTTTAPTTTTTIATKTPVIKTLKQWRAADKYYLAQLKVINDTFLAAVATAKLNLSTAIASTTNSNARISARATYRFAITEATIARSNALTLLGKAPEKPKGVTTTTL
jgi:CTP synthase (UTP-ammonia lyase)